MRFPGRGGFDRLEADRAPMPCFGGEGSVDLGFRAIARKVAFYQIVGPTLNLQDRNGRTLALLNVP